MVLRKAAIIGNVDNGKSTLIGQLLRQTGELKSDQIHKVERLSQLGGRSFTDLSLCTDGLETEVKEAKTIDISFKFIDTPGVRIQLADCPGHLEYFTKTASALSNSEVLVLVLDINSGITAQTSFLLKMAKFFELNSIIVCVNKMDTVGFCAATFEKVASAIKEISEGLEIKCKVIPTSGKTGENLVGRTEKLVWWKGETLMDCLEKQIEIEDKSEEDTWLGVQNVFGGSFSGASEQVQGFLLSGALRRRR
ncbi:GTP-binding protein [bacterium]|nr:GTP-binding protein [bacterium]